MSSTTKLENKRGRGKPVTHPRVKCQETGEIFSTYLDAGKSVGGSRHGVRRNCEGTQAHHKGYHFKWVK